MTTQTKASGLDRFLRLFADVRPGEGLTAVLLALAIFLLLTAYYILKPVRDALILAEGSAELASYMSAGMVGVLAVAVPLYGRLAARVSRRRLINVVSGFFAACLVVFYALSRFGVPLGVPYFIWIGVFNMMIVAQFWAFANDLYTHDEGERLFPIVGFGMSTGAVLGAVIAGWLIAPVGLDQLMLLGGVILALQALLITYIDRREIRRTSTRPATAPGRPEDEAATSGRSTGAFTLVFKTPYLLMIGIMLLCLNCVNTTGGYILASVVEDSARAAVASGAAGGLSVEQYVGQFYSHFYGVVNIAGVLIQLFLVSRIIKYLGVRVGVLVLPCLAFGAYSLLAFAPILTAVRWAKTAENATDYSLNNTVRNMLFLPCTREQKYSAKQAIDAFFVRTGDVVSAVVVFVGTTFLALDGSGFAKIAIGMVLVWVVLAVAVGREYVRLTVTGTQPGQRLVAPPAAATVSAVASN